MLLFWSISEPEEKLFFLLFLLSEKKSDASFYPKLWHFFSPQTFWDKAMEDSILLLLF
jgi:hypothetical protein